MNMQCTFFIKIVDLFIDQVKVKKKVADWLQWLTKDGVRYFSTEIDDHLSAEKVFRQFYIVGD